MPKDPFTSLSLSTELETFTHIDVDASLQDLDYALRSYLAFAARFYGNRVVPFVTDTSPLKLVSLRTDAYLKQEADLDHCIHQLLHSDLFQNYADRSTDGVIELAATVRLRFCTRSNYPILN